MTGLTNQNYVNTLSHMTIGVASVYNQVIDPWVISGVINQNNTEFSNTDLYEGITATRMYDSGAKKRADRRAFEPTNGRVMVDMTTCTAPGYEYHSCDPDDNTAGQKLDVRIINSMLNAQSPTMSTDYLVGAISSAGVAVYNTCARDLLPLVYASMNVKTNYDSTSAAGTPTTFDNDCPHAGASQVVSFTTYPATDSAADIGLSLHRELIAAILPLNAYNPYGAACITIPTEVYHNYVFFLDAGLNSDHFSIPYEFRRNACMNSSEVHSTYGKSYTIVDGGPMDTFPLGSGSDSFLGLITKEGGLKFKYGVRAIDYAASFDSVSSLASIIPNAGAYIETVANAMAAERGSYSFSRDVSASETDPYMLGLMQQGNFGGNALLNILGANISKIGYGNVDAMHYAFEVTTQAAVVRANPALLRKWIIPFAKLQTPPDLPLASSRATPGIRKTQLGKPSNME